MNDAILFERAAQAAVQAGLLPAQAHRVADDSRPWPVVLLTALGAWLAAIPLLGVVGLLLGDLISRGVGPYFVGSLVLVGACVTLRSSSLPLFFEQLTVPALLVGGGSLAFGLFRDLPDPAAAGVLAVIALAVAIALPRAWLRVLLGAAAAMLLVFAIGPQRWYDFGVAWRHHYWWAWHLVLTLAAAGVGLQQAVEGARPRLAGALESLLAGWLLATLAGLAWWSGMTLLVGASLGAELARDLGSQASVAWHSTAPQAGSVLLAVGAVVWGVRRWPSCRQPWCAGLAAVLIALAWFMPALGAALLALVWAATTQRWRLAGAAGVAAAWVVGSFYYQLQWPLAIKAAVLVAAGAALGVLVWWALRGGPRDAAAAAPTPPRVSLGVAAAAFAVLAVANFGIWQKERLISQGRPVFVELAPVDPRSLMQGDYMALNFRVPSAVQDSLAPVTSAHRPRLVARIDARGVAEPVRVDDGSALAADELRIELTPRRGHWVLVTDAWFFEEGEAARWQPARYGEFRVAPDGKALLVGLRNAELRPL